MRGTGALLRRVGWIPGLVLALGAGWPTTSTAEVGTEAPAAADSGGISAPAVDENPNRVSESLAPDDPADEVELPYFALMSKLALGLGLVVLLVWACIFLLRKSAFGRQFGGAGGAVRVVERTFLAPKKAIYLVEIGGRTLALGVTEEHIALLAEWEAGEVCIEPGKGSPASLGAQFRSLLGQAGKGEK